MAARKQAEIIDFTDEMRRVSIVAHMEKQASARIDSPRMTVIVVDITPAMAEQLLGLRPRHQRTIRPYLVAAYAADMKAGRWVPNGASIVINRDFDLVDGQHRLTAIVESEVTAVSCTIVLCKIEGAEITIDVGRSRTPADVMRLGKMAGADLSRQRQAAIVWEHCGFSREKRKTIARTEFAKIVSESDMHEAVKAINGKAPAGIIGAYIAAYRKAPDEAVAFFNAALDGLHEINGVHVPALRILANWILSIRSQKNYAGDNYTRECTFRAAACWNAWRTGKPIKMLPKYHGPTTEIPEAV